MTLSERILAVLGESPLPIATPDLIELLADPRRNARQMIHARLRFLLAGGLVQSEVRVRKDARGARNVVAYWRLARQPAALAGCARRVE